MAQNSQTNTPPHENIILEGQLRECYARVVYSHKTHEKLVDILLKKQSHIHWIQITLSAVTAGSLLPTILGNESWTTNIAMVVSTLLLVLNTYTKNYNLVDTATKHKKAANELWLIREKYLSLLTDLAIGNKKNQVITKERDQLLKKLSLVYRGSPSTSSHAYKKAQKALQISEDMTFSDIEIDQFLPKELKRTEN